MEDVADILRNINPQYLESLPMVVSGSDVYIGQKVFVALPMKEKDDRHVYLFVENTLPLQPKEKAIGFTEEEITNNIGIYIFTKTRSGIAIGKTYPINELINVLDLSARNKLIFKLEQMRQTVKLDDDFIAASNSMLPRIILETIH
jgi:hypothetical protein